MNPIQQEFNDSISSVDSECINFDQITTGYYVEEDDLRPSGVFANGYRELSQYEKTAFAGVTLKKTKNGHRAKSGVQLERSISPKRKN